MGKINKEKEAKDIKGKGARMCSDTGKFVEGWMGLEKVYAV